MPLYPMIDDRNATESSYAVVNERAWNRNHKIMAWQRYLGHAGKQEVSPYAALPVQQIPPTYTMIGRYDVFCDETFDYVKRLSQKGGPVEFHLYPGGFHVFEFGVSDAPVSLCAQTEYVDALGRGLAPPG